MTWVQLDDLFPEHPKVMNAGPLAKALYVDALCYASRYLTDGKLSKQIARRLARDYADFTDPDLLIQALLDASLWNSNGDDYVIHDYLNHQRSSEQIGKDKAAARERMANKRGGSGEVRPNKQGSSGEVQQPEVDTEVDTEVDVTPTGVTTTAPGAQTPPRPVEPVSGKKPLMVVPERNAPQIPPNPPEPPLADLPPAQPFDLLDALCDEVGADVSVLAKPQKDKQLGVAKRLVESGMTVRDVRAMTRWLLGQDWVTSGVDLFLLEKQLGKWQMQGKPAVAVVRSRGRPTATESVFDEALDETRRKRGQPDDNVFDIA